MTKRKNLSEWDHVLVSLCGGSEAIWVYPVIQRKSSLRLMRDGPEPDWLAMTAQAGQKIIKYAKTLDKKITTAAEPKDVLALINSKGDLAVADAIIREVYKNHGVVEILPDGE